MKNIAYAFVRTNPLSYGELSQEKNANGTVVDTLTVNMINNTRSELRADGKTRTFTYGATLGPGGTTKAYLLKSYTDFNGNLTTLNYNADGFLSSRVDAKSHTTSYEYLNQGFPTGVITKITHPSDSQTTSSNIQYYYTDATGAYLDHVIDERSKLTTYKRNSGTLTTYEIDYPDTGIEKYTYNSFGQVLTHTMPSNTATGTTGGTENFFYDTCGLLLTYTPPPTGSDPSPALHPTKYTYDINDHLFTITDPRSKVTTLFHNEIGQTTVVREPDTDTSETVSAYNADGTLQSQNVQLTATTFALTSYTYDDYKRPLTVTDPLLHKTKFWYDKAGAGLSDLSHTDANPTQVVSPRGTITRTLYDANLRKDTVTAGYNTIDAATTNYDFDPVGNLTAVTDPKAQKTSYFYDARDRLIHVNDPIATDRNADNYTTSYTYDAASNKTLERRANDQTITYDSYDSMNRLLQMTVHQSPTPDAVSHYTWTKAGKLDTMTDPRSNLYNYDYDVLNRLITTTYPAGGGTETRLYDWSGNLATFKSRAGATQTFTYDSRDRETYNSWSTGNPQPRTIIYDDASRIKSCNTTNTFINFTYFDDNRLKTQEEWGTFNSATGVYYGDGTHRTLTYTYDADGNRASIAYPFLPAYEYEYTNRNQIMNMTWSYDNSKVVSYTYDKNGNWLTRTPGTNPASSFVFDPLNRVTNITHNFASPSSSKTLHYGYDEVGRTQYKQRDGGLADGYGYGLSEQVADFRVNGTVNLSTGAVSGGTLTSFVFDASGNRTKVTKAGVATNYDPANNLNEYTKVGGVSVTNGTLGNVSAYNGWSYSYDSQRRLSSADKSGVTSDFYYDGLNRQVARVINGVTTYSVWDGWTLAAEYGPGPVLRNRYIYAGNDLIRSPSPSGIYYYPDAQGSTVDLASDTGTLLEKYTYDLYGTPTYYNASGTVLPNGSAYDVEHLFTGQQWYPELGLYDLRNRAYHPGLGRFLQPDPIGFAGDPANLYRYCGNNPVNWSDPSGKTPLIGTAIGFVSGAVGGAITGYAQGGWEGLAIGSVVGGVVGAGVGTVVDFAGGFAGSAAADAVVAAALGTSSSVAGQAASSAATQLSQNNEISHNPMSDVNWGAAIGAGVTAPAGPLFEGVAAQGVGEVAAPWARAVGGGTLSGLFTAAGETLGAALWNNSRGLPIITTWGGERWGVGGPRFIVLVGQAEIDNYKKKHPKQKDH